MANVEGQEFGACFSHSIIGAVAVGIDLAEHPFQFKRSRVTQFQRPANSAKKVTFIVK
jgi:hypothetical protein